MFFMHSFCLLGGNVAYAHQILLPAAEFGCNEEHS
jgi:hypothetical protein